MDIPLVPDYSPSPPKKYNSKKKKSQYGQWKKQSSSVVSHHQCVELHHTLASDVLSRALFSNDDQYQTPNKPLVYENWRTTRAVLSQDKIIQTETLMRVAVEEIIVQEMAKMLSAEDKANNSNK